MNRIYQALKPFLTQHRSMGYIGIINGSRYGCIDNIDYTGKKYIIPYTCTSYSDDIDGLILDAVCDVPSEDYLSSMKIIEMDVNKQLKRQYGFNFNVTLLPPGKTLRPPCHNLG